VALCFVAIRSKRPWDAQSPHCS